MKKSVYLTGFVPLSHSHVTGRLVLSPREICFLKYTHQSNSLFKDIRSIAYAVKNCNTENKGDL